MIRRLLYQPNVRVADRQQAEADRALRRALQLAWLIGALMGIGTLLTVQGLRAAWPIR